MRTVFILSFVANVMLSVVGMFVCPSEMAIHFGAGGEPDGWAPSYVNALLMTLVNLLLFLTLLYSPRLIRTLPPSCISLPNKEYWLRDENRGRAESMILDHMYLFGAATLVFMFAIGLLTLQANLSVPVRLREDLLWWTLGLYVAFTAVWIVGLVRAFRLPAAGSRSP